MSSDLVLRPSQGMAPFSVEAVIQEALARRDMMVRFGKEIMVAGIDYGKIPGTDKNTLLKAGAEKLCSGFRMVPRPTIVESVTDWTGEDHGGEPFLYFLVRCALYTRDGELICEASGSCNSWEPKYRFRNAKRKCPHCGQASIIKGKEEFGGGFLCFKNKGGCGAKFKINDPDITQQQIGQITNDDICDLANTLLKMAEKRALIAATLLGANASEFYTQDLEDMSAHLRASAYAPAATEDAATAETHTETTTQQSETQKPVQSRPVRTVKAETVETAKSQETASASEGEAEGDKPATLTQKELDDAAVQFTALCNKLNYAGKKSVLARLLVGIPDETPVTKFHYYDSLQYSQTDWEDCIERANALQQPVSPPPIHSDDGLADVAPTPVTSLDSEPAAPAVPPSQPATSPFVAPGVQTPTEKPADPTVPHKKSVAASWTAMGLPMDGRKPVTADVSKIAMTMFPDWTEKGTVTDWDGLAQMLGLLVKRAEAKGVKFCSPEMDDGLLACGLAEGQTMVDFDNAGWKRFMAWLKGA